MEFISSNSKAIGVLRWISFLPAAVAAAWFAWLLVTFLNRITIGMQGLNPDSFLSRAFIEYISHAVMGGVFVFVGARVAPNYSEVVAYALAGLGLVFSGFLFFAAVLTNNYWSVWAGISFIIGLVGTAYAIKNDNS